MKIRKARKRDILRILELFNSDPNLTSDDNFKYKKNHILEFVINPINKTLVYELDNKIVGVVQAEFWKTAKYVLLNDIIVDKDYRRKGIGFELQSHIEKLAKKQGMNLLFLYSEIDNKKTHGMLGKGGYKRGKKMYFFSKKIK